MALRYTLTFYILKKNLILLEHNLHIVGSYQIIHCVLQFQPMYVLLYIFQNSQNNISDNTITLEYFPRL